MANVRGLNINYEIIGEDGPAVALVTGGRRGYDEFVPLAGKIAAGGYRVFLHDRRNTGASDMLIASDEVEEAVWADDLCELLSQHDALPAFVGGSSAGARTSIMLGLRHPEAAAGLLLFRVTGGAFAAKRLPENYYGQFIRAAREGGMAAVCAMDAYAERIAANPANGDKLMAMDPKVFIEHLSRLLALFEAGANLPVMGVTAEQLGAMKIPTMVIPGNDNTHSSDSGRTAHQLIPGSELHQLPITDQDVDLVPFEEWAPLEDEIAATFIDFMGRVTAGRQAAE
jgi:pimeloyl-ACP methyl ester carboxylesterase